MNHSFKTFEEIVEFLKDIDYPLGDLCQDILRDPTFPLKNDEDALKKIDILGRNHDYLSAPTMQLDLIYRIINKI